MSNFSPAVIIVHPSGTNNVGYESAFPLWVTGSTAAFPSVQTVTGTVKTDITGTVNVNVQTLPNVTGSVNVTNSLFNVTGSTGVTNWPLTYGSVSSPAPSSSLLVGGVDNSNRLRAMAVDPKGRPIAIKLAEAVSLGMISGSEAGWKQGIINTSSTTALPVTVVTYLEGVATGAARSVVSSVATDNAAGTGARTVKIIYHDINLNGPFTETVTMNGTTPVNTVATNICYVEDMQVVTVGSATSNNGTITLKTATGGGGSNFVQMAAFDNSLYAGRHYVPPGKKCMVMTLGAAGSASYSLFTRITNMTSGTTAARDQRHFFSRVPAVTGVNFDFSNVPLILTGPAKFEIFAWCSVATSQRFDCFFHYLDMPSS